MLSSQENDYDHIEPPEIISFKTSYQSQYFDKLFPSTELSLHFGHLKDLNYKICFQKTKEYFALLKSMTFFLFTLSFVFP